MLARREGRSSPSRATIHKVYGWAPFRGGNEGNAKLGGMMTDLLEVKDLFVVGLTLHILSDRARLVLWAFHRMLPATLGGFLNRGGNRRSQRAASAAALSLARGFILFYTTYVPWWEN
jgi:hypothetical protein